MVLHNKNEVLDTSTIEFPYSDHKMVLVNCDFKSNVVYNNIRMSRKLNEKIINEIGDEINAIDFSILHEINNLNTRFDCFKQILHNLINKLAPLRKKKQNRKLKNLPWFDQDLIRAEHRCSKLHAKYMKINSQINYNKFHQARDDYHKLLRSKKTIYFSNHTPSDSREFWSFYSSVIDTKSSQVQNDNSPKAIKIDGSIITDKNQIADEFNKYFSSFSSETSVSSKDCEKFSLNVFKKMNFSSVNCEFSFKSTNEIEVEKFLNEINNRSSPGITDIAVVVLKSGTKSVSTFLARLFNDCITTGVFPNEWKIASVRVLHKKGDRNDMNNYRGISILTPITKVFEKILSKQIKEYFLTNNILDPNQHGFREAFSCESALHEVINTCLKNMDAKLANALLFVDFKKAFDLVNQDLLIYKLANYGFSNAALKLIKSYFDDRFQAVKIDNISSAKTQLGVGQGSVLGPLLFIIFINDLPYYLNEFVTKLFEDDTTVISTGENAEMVISNVRKSILKINEWCKHNKMHVNWTKTFVMYVTNRRFQLPDNIQVEDKTIECVSKLKLLGVTLDSKLNFSDFVSQQCASINRKL